MRRYLVASCLAMMASVLLAPSALRADSFAFNISGLGVSASGAKDTEVVTASGTFIATSEGNGEYLVTSMSGTLNGSAITLLSDNSFDENDNLFITQPGAIEVDGNGISFVANGVDYNLFDRNSSYVLDEGSQSASQGLEVTFDPTSVMNTPEPSSFLLLATGLAGVLFVFRRKLQLV